MSKYLYFFSFRSPYSWISWIKLKENISHFELIPYWDPDEKSQEMLKLKGGSFLYSPMTAYKHRYILQDIKRIANELNIKVKFPVDVSPFWELPHLLYFYAKQKKCECEYIDEVYKYRWELGENICSVSVMRLILSNLNVDTSILDNIENLDKYRDNGVSALYKAYENNVFGIPFFIKGWEKLWGVDRIKYLDFEKDKSIENISEDSLRIQNNFSNNFSDHPGGCG